MKKIHLFTCIIVVLLIMPVCTLAQSLKVVKNFDKVPFASVLAVYNDYFQKWENPNVDNSFSYAVIRVRLEGNQHEVLAAKQHLNLYLGQHYVVETTIRDIENELLFLVPSSAGYVTITCGEGCKRLQILSLNQLEADAVYDGIVHYIPAEENTNTDLTQQSKYQFFKFRVNPISAMLEVQEKDQWELWPINDNGMTDDRMFKYGTYHYRISANRYYSAEGTFTVSDTLREKTISLLPKFGRLNIMGDSILDGAYVITTFVATGERQNIGSIPIKEKELDSGEYQILIKQNKYKDYVTTVNIQDGKIVNVKPTLIPNFAKVELTTTTQDAGIYLNNERLGTGRWHGTLEYGDYTIETRKENHKSAYTSLRVVSETPQQVFKLNNPTPICGFMVINGSPTGANVYIDEEFVGVAPIVINDLLIGNHNVRVEKVGYENYEQKINIQEKKELSFSYALTNSAQVTIMVKNDSLANIYIRPLFGNGVERLLGKSGWSGSLAIGEYAVRTARSGHKDSHTTIVVKSTQPTYTVNAPCKEQGTLYITSDPIYSSVYINDKYKGSTPYNGKLSPGTYTAYITHDGYENSKKRTINIVDGGKETLEFNLKKKRKKIEVRHNLGPYHLFELQYGYGLNIKDLSFTDHHVGLTYGYSPSRFGLNTSVNYGIYSQDIGISVGPTIRLTDMYSACNLQLMLGGGMVIRPRHLQKPLTWSVDAGLRFSFEEDSNFAWYSFTLGARYYDYTIIPTASVSLFPARLLYLAAAAEEDFPCLYTDVMSGYAFTSDDWLLGAQISYIPSHLGIGAGFMFGLNGGWDVTAGPVFRLTPDYQRLDLQIYQGFGYGSYSNDGFVAETSLRFGFGYSNPHWGLWSLDIGCIYGPDDIAITFGMSIPLVGMIGSCGLGAIFL